jgi:cytochrome c oxidase cbb3-type subunit I/II
MYPDFVETINAIKPMWMLRALGGTLFLAGALLGGINLYKTWKSRPRTYEEPVHRAPALSPVYEGDERPPVSPLQGAQVAEVAKRLDVWSTLWWHRKWERLPVKFTVLTTLAVVVASLFEIIPTFLIRSNVPTISTVHPYTPLELEGRDIYIAEGCYNCHSQMVRPILAETKRYGDYSKPGEFVYDRPFQWGSRRIGPDLAREGRRLPNAHWHYRHFLSPSDTVPGSVMPSYGWLRTQAVDFKSIPLRVRAMQALGVPYSDRDRAGAVEAARRQGAAIASDIARGEFPDSAARTPEEKQLLGEAQTALAGELADKKVVALTAYLLRLGTDIYGNPDAPVARAVAEPRPTSAAPAGLPLSQMNP